MIFSNGISLPLEVEMNEAVVQDKLFVRRDAASQLRAQFKIALMTALKAATRVDELEHMIDAARDDLATGALDCGHTLGELGIGRSEVEEIAETTRSEWRAQRG